MTDKQKPGMKFSTSQAVEHTKRLFPSTNPIGYHLNGGEQITDERLRTIPILVSDSPPDAEVKSFASNTVQGPASIAELARALNVGPAGNGPQLMYEWVYSNIEWEPGWGANKGALGCLLDGMGTQFDQAMLLAALLRTSGYTANIVMGSIRLTEAQYQAWWKVNDIWGAQSYCANEFIPIVTAPTWTGSEWYMDIKHVWVQWVDGVNTYIFDPSYKQYTRKTGLSSSALASALGYNSSTFMTNAQSGATVTTDYAQNINRSNIRSNLQTLTSNLVTYINGNSIGSAPAGTATIDDLLGGQSIVSPTIPLLQASLPYQKPGDSPTVWTGDVPSSFKPTLQIQFPNWSTPGVWDFTYQTTSENLAGKRLTLWYDANRVPKLYLDGTLVATGLQQPVGTWTSIYLTVAHPAYDASNYPLSWQQWYQTSFQWWQSFIYTVGYYLIGSAWGNLGDGQTALHQKRTKANEAAGGSSTSEPVLGERLATAFYSWAAQNSKVCDLANRLTNCHTTYSHQVGVVAFNNDGKNAITVDLGGVSGSSTNLDNDTTKTPINDTVLAMHGVALEAAVPAQVTGLTPGVSTTSVIDKAVQLGDRIYKGTSSNWNTGSNVRNTLVANGFNGTDMDNLYNWYIQFGNTVLIHNQPSRTLGSWQGWGYWAYPTAGAYGIINGGIKGGSGQQGEILIDNWGRRIDPATGQPRSWDPIGMTSGDFSYANTDLTIGSGEYPHSLPFVRHYSSSRQFVDGPLGRGWKHCYKIAANVSSDGLLAMGAESAAQAAASLAQFYVSVDLVSDTSRPVAKLVTMTLGDNWWIDQIVNNTVVVDFPDSSHTFIKQPNGTYTAPLNGPSVLTLSGGLYTVKTPDQISYNFNSSGNIATIVFPYGVTITCTYTSGKLTSISNGLTRTLTLAYTGNYITSVSDGTGRSVTFSVNGTTKNLDSVTDPNSKTTTFVYDNPGRLKQIKKPANPTVAVVDNVYDTLDRVKEQRDASSNLWQYFLAGSRAEEKDPQNNRKVQYFNRFGLVVREIDQLGKVWSFEYDGLNRQTKASMPAGNSVTQSYDLKGNVLTRTFVPKAGSGLSNTVHTFTYHSTFNKVLTATDGLSRVTTYTYDAVKGTLLTVQQPTVGGLTPTCTFTWSTRGQMLTRLDQTGIKTKFNYDPTTETLSSIVHDEGVGRLNLTTSFGYNSRGDVTSVTDARSKTTTIQVDVMRRVTQTTAPSPLSYITKFQYDDNGNRKKTEIETGNVLNPWQTFTATFRADDLIASVTDPGNQITSYDYTSLRQLWKTTDAASRVVERTYDAAGRLSTVKDQATNTTLTRTYTDSGRIASVKDARNNLTTFEFDGHDRPKKTVFPDSSYEQVNTYDANNNATEMRMRSGNIVTTTYDELKRVKTRTPQSMATVTFTYDLASRLLKRSVPVVAGDPSTGDFESFFDSAGRFYKERYPDGKEVTHVLDANGNATKTTWPDGYFVDKIFDEINRLTNIKLNGSGSSALVFAYDKMSKRTKLTYGNSVVTDYGFELDNDLSTLTQTFNGSSVVFTYGYNNVHELTSQQVSDGANFMWHPALGGTTSFGTVNSLNQYPTIGGVSRTYNTNGCMTGDGTWTFGYDTENHLISATKTGVSASYKYDPLHRQAQKVVGSTKTRYIYSGQQRIADYDGTSGALLNRYVFGTRLDEPLIKVTAGGTLSYLHHDKNGNVIATTDNTGAVVNRFKYSPWGESPSMTGTTFGYQGQRYDDETGLYFMKARYFDPKSGRFLQPDPIGYSDGLNLYQFGYNNPNSFSDPLGLWGDWGPYAAGPGANGGWGGTSGYANGYGPLGPPGTIYVITPPPRSDGGPVGGGNNYGHSYGGNGPGDLQPGWGNPANGTPNFGGNNFGHSYGGNSPGQNAPGWGDPNNPTTPVNWGGSGSPFTNPDFSNYNGASGTRNWPGTYQGSGVTTFGPPAPKPTPPSSVPPPVILNGPGHGVIPVPSAPSPSVDNNTAYGQPFPYHGPIFPGPSVDTGDPWGGLNPLGWPQNGGAKGREGLLDIWGGIMGSPK
jgi:RHS repeat-associated protein